MIAIYNTYGQVSHNFFKIHNKIAEL